MAFKDRTKELMEALKNAGWKKTQASVLDHPEHGQLILCFMFSKDGNGWFEHRAGGYNPKIKSGGAITSRGPVFVGQTLNTKLVAIAHI